MITCDWIPSEAKDEYTVSVKDAGLVEVNKVVVFEERVFFSDRLFHMDEVYTIQVDDTSTLFIPVGGFTVSFLNLYLIFEFCSL